MLPELGGKTEELELEKLSDEPKGEHPEVTLLKLINDNLHEKIDFLEKILGCSYHELKVRQCNDHISKALITRIEQLESDNEKLKKALDLWQNSANDAWEREEHNRNHPFGGPEVKWRNETK